MVNNAICRSGMSLLSAFFTFVLQVSYSESSDSSDDNLPEINIKSAPFRSKAQRSTAATWKGNERAPDSPPQPSCSRYRCDALHS